MASWQANSPTTVLPAPVGAQTSTERPVARWAIASERSTVLLGTLDDQVWGQTLVSLEELDEGVLARVDQLWVDPEARNIGLGRTMMLAAVTWARSADCVGIDAAALPGDRSTKNFFESFGLVARELIVHTGLGDHADI